MIFSKPRRAPIAVAPAQPLRARKLARPLPRKKLTRMQIALLLALRIYVSIAVPLVVYAFVRALRTP